MRSPTIRRPRPPGGQKDPEFIPAEPETSVHLFAHGFADDVSKQGQDLVPGLVAVNVVDLLEFVAVDEHEVESVSVLAAAAGQFPYPGLEQAPVAKPGQGVALGELLVHFFAVVGLFELHLEARLPGPIRWVIQSGCV
jgi:hypothetical protein